MGGLLGYFDGLERVGGMDLLRIVRRGQAGFEGSGLWVAGFGLDDLVDGISEKSNGG